MPRHKTHTKELERIFTKYSNHTEEELLFAWKKYSQHKASTKCSKRIDKAGNIIEFRLSFDEWWDTWVVSGYWDKRGCRLGEYCMCRFSDLGHYEAGNIFIDRADINLKDGRIGIVVWNKGVKGAGKPPSRKGCSPWNKGKKTGPRKRAPKSPVIDLST